MKLSHVDDRGVKMVNISDKKEEFRTAKAEGVIRLKRSTIKLIDEGKVGKGDVFTTSQIAAILAVKKTPDIIPMCHPIQITGVEVDFDFIEESVKATVTVRSVGKTGVEMEAVTGVSVALLTIWDMVKASEKDEYGQYPVTEISDIKVIEKMKGERR